MHGFIIFILGCFLGGFVGVALMCMLQINRINRYEMKDKKDDEAPQDPPLEGETQSSVDSVSDVVLNISKNRNGRLGRVRFIFFKDTCRFEVAADEDEGEY